MGLSTGMLLGPYEILGPIGAGGMGEVYKARDTRLDRTVAVKISTEQFSERFEREARAVAALNHPNICTLHDVGPNYLVMEYIEGATLAERMAAGPVPLAEALAIARQIAEALEAAHEKGIVHRDLKPGNVKVKSEGQVKVLDFGLAKAFEGEAASGDPANSPTLTLAATRQGVILGTAGYMSPEQARGVAVDKRADIWAFGVVLFEMLTGRQTFAGETISDTLAAVLRADLDWTALPQDTPAPVRRLLRRLLQRDRKRRLHDIGDARLEIDEALAAPAETAAVPAAPARRNSRWWIAATAAAGLAALALAFVHFRERPAEAPAVRFQVSFPENTTFSGHLSISPDGRRIAFAATGAEGRTQLWLRPLDSLEARPLSGTDNAGYFFWSPDSRSIAYWADGKLKKVEVSGGPPQTLCDTPLALGGAWNRDGVILFGSNAYGLSRVSAAGGNATRVTQPDASRPELYHAWPVFLPDGKHFFYLAGSSGEEARAIYVAELDSKLQVRNAKRLTPTRAGMAYAPSSNPQRGYLIFLREGALMAQAFDVSRLALAGEAFPIAEQVGSFLTRGFFAASNSGTLVYRAGSASSQQLVWFDRAGKSMGNAGPPGPYNDVALSPEGQRVAVAKTDPQTGTDLWLLDLARGGASTRFTFFPALEAFPVWSPDGARIVFASNRDGSINLYQKVSSGAGNEEPLLQSNLAKRPYDFSPDGRFLLYALEDPKTKRDLWVLPLQGDRKPAPYLQTAFNETQGQFSPDGHWVAYVSDESGSWQVYVQPFPASGGKWQISSNGGVEPRWRGDGKELFYLGWDRRLMSVQVKTTPKFEAGLPKALFELGMYTVTPNYFRYAAAADGQRFLVNSVPGESSGTPITVVLNWNRGKPE